MTNEVFERVARAIEGALPNQMKHLGPLLARAAIAAMRDPTAKMMDAAIEVWKNDPDGPVVGFLEDLYRAMIDAAPS